MVSAGGGQEKICHKNPQKIPFAKATMHSKVRRIFSTANLYERMSHLSKETLRGTVHRLRIRVGGSVFQSARNLHDSGVRENINESLARGREAGSSRSRLPLAPLMQR